MKYKVVLLKNKMMILILIIALLAVFFYLHGQGDKGLSGAGGQGIEGQVSPPSSQSGEMDTVPFSPSLSLSSSDSYTAGEKKDNESAKETANGQADKEEKQSFINENGKTVQDRILVPDGYERIKVERGSFGEYLRELPLKPHGSKVIYYNGDTKPREVHEAVLDIDVGERDLQQCADSVIRLRAEYLYGKGLYDLIHFNFTNGFKADYSTWMDGNRIKVSGNKAYWVEQGSASMDYDSFRKYLDIVFAYAGTLSLSKEMMSIPLEELQPGDVFMYGQTPGHCVIVLDMAEDNTAGEKCFILAQGYMPAQDMHILKNPANEDGNPWYTINFGEKLNTPEWEFSKEQLMRFEE